MMWVGTEDTKIKIMIRNLGGIEMATDNSLVIMIGMFVFFILVLWWLSKKTSSLPIDNMRRSFSNMEKFRVAEKCIKDFGKLRCYECGKDENLEVDHIIPLTRRRSHNGLSNLCLRCRRCNASKGDRYVG